MSVDKKRSKSQLIIYPNPDWYIYNENNANNIPNQLKFPPLYYSQVKNLNVPFDCNQTAGDLVLGGSYSLFCNLPLYLERCAIFEDLYMPYKLNSKYFHIRHGVLLWPRINLNAYTYLPDPQRVFIYADNKYIAEFKFSPNRIELIEVVFDGTTTKPLRYQPLDQDIK